MPGRKFSTGSGYRYGFNGKEFDKDAGEGIQDYGMRIYNGRLGRFLSVDPLIIKYPFYSPYQFSGNDVIRCIDLDGGEPKSKTQDCDWNTTTLTGTVYNNVYDKTSHRNFDMQGVVDPSTGKLWIVADDGQGQHQYFYLVNDDGSSDKIRTYNQNGRTVLYKSHFERFETQNQIEQKAAADVPNLILGFLGVGAATAVAAPVIAPYALAYGTQVATVGVAPRFIAAAADLGVQYVGNTMQYGFGMENVNNINITTAGFALVNPASIVTTASAAVGKPIALPPPGFQPAA